MDYEKEYNEAFKRAKELHEAGNALTKKQMEIVFPSLAESEDERIRKLLVWQVHRNIEDETNDLAGSVYDGVKGHDPDLEESIEDWKKCLAWLEKQKINTEGDFGRGYDCGYEACLNSHGAEWFEKQKEHQNNNSSAPNESSWAGNISSSHKDKNLDEIAQDYVDGVKEYNPEPTWDLMQTAVCYGYHYCEQKEQKPLPPFDEHTPEERMNHPLFLEGFDTGREVQKVFDEQQPAELETLGKPMTHEEWAEDYWEHHKFASPNGNDKCDVIQFEHKGFIDFCMAYCVDQKPQDRLVLHDTFGYEKGRQVGQREGVEMVLKTPESYGLYKPAEWSEEDERIRLSCIKTIDAVIDDERERWEDYNPGKPYRPIMSYDEQIDWLKSLRPHWKPSEEQMYSLGTVVNGYDNCTVGSVGYNLKKLYEQLKKLM